MYEPVAIVGTACRFPGAANSPSRLWDLLKEPRDVVKDFPLERLNMGNFYNDNGETHGRTNVHHKSYLLEEDVRRFDAAFFRINPKEAADMDPQQRILLETVYESFESAGWSLNHIDGSPTSVHVGVMTDDYTLISSRDPDMLGSHAATGLSRAILSNRISYAFNLQGPSMTLDTACSSSLVALHLAIQGLHSGEAVQAVVAGTNLLMDTIWYIAESSMHMLSSDSHSRMWDKDASGYARGEGCAAVVLKPLSKAIADGDNIECVIRATGVNSDGRSNGITMPTPTAQAALIRETYGVAGLDPITDRCQYFECHGTGTQAGDPVEAQAIRDAFFPNGQRKEHDILYCGSIKTIIGHLEGCAGLAGLIKASLAIQNKAIPPNLHFHQLNPRVEPFYNNLEIPTSLLPWPETHSQPRRASINSFGFGGTNAHAILESYEPSDAASPSPPSSSVHTTMVGGRLVGPFVFSARTPRSLLNSLKKLLGHLRANSSLDLDSLSNSLHSKRSVFPYRVTIPSALDREDLIQRLEDQVNTVATSTLSPLGGGTGDEPRIFGVFTGQGAQAPRMGYALLQHCKLFQDSIRQCDLALKSIPDAPEWSLAQELAADAATSCVSQAEFSQPLCTAVQIGLVDLLRASGIRFCAVVGHSSGEIGAAYAAGLLTRRDAMGISYYRGHVAHLAQGNGGRSGGMMAVATSLDDAVALCSEQQFKGRISIAASNSPSSTTLSGDADAVVEAKRVLDGRNIQARLLQVDTAYHSHQMLACVDAYAARLKQLNVRVQMPASDDDCRWYSSVKTNTDILTNPSEFGLEGQYWLDNMVQPVYFSEAVKLAVQDASTKFSAAIEVGPHPALRGPLRQTLTQSIDYTPHYAALLSRDGDSIETCSEALAALWSISPSSIDFGGWRRAFGLVAQPQAIKNLPPYSWDHTQIHWRESRVVQNYRLGKQLPHDLLGRLWNDSQYEQVWRNIFLLHEMPWLKGHVFQNQVLFPATGYISLAVDAAKAFVKGRAIKLIQVEDMLIPTALVIGGERDEVEVLFIIRSHVSPQNVEAGSVLEAEFACYSYPDRRDADRTCHGRLRIHLGEFESADLAPVCISDVNLTPFNIDRFYGAASEMGFQYQGPFRALTSLDRCWGHAKAVASWSTEDLNIDCTLHPAILDVTLQAGLSTFLSAAENSMASSYLPVGIKRVVINPNERFRGPNHSTNVDIEAYMVSRGLGKLMEIDINLRDQMSLHGNVCGIQMEGVNFKAISEPQPSDDRNILAKTVWGLDVAYGLIHPLADAVPLEPLLYTSEDYERVALFYLQALAHSVNKQELERLKPQHQQLIYYINAIVTKVRTGDQSHLRREWLDDDSATIEDVLSRHPGDVDMAMLKVNGEKSISLLRGDYKSTNEVLEMSSSSSYQDTQSFALCIQFISQLVRQVSHKFPRTNVLEICTGTGSAAAGVFDAIGDAYESYTCAGSSETVLSRLKESLIAADLNKIGSFRHVDFETDLTSQEDDLGLYDVVIVTGLLRASPTLAQVVQNLRHVLRPGGFLIAMALTGASLRPIALMGGLENWSRGSNSRATHGYAVKTGDLDKLLHRSGFSGIDCILHDQPDSRMHGVSVFSAQAVDDRFEILRDPLPAMGMIPPNPVTIIGGETSRVSSLIRRIDKLLRAWAPEIQVYGRFDEVDMSRIQPASSVIVLQDLDRPLFSSFPTENEMENLKEVLGTCKNTLWVTSGRLVDDPYANIMIGIGRSLRLELTHVSLQFLDFDAQDEWDVHALVRQFLRLVFSSSSPDTAEGMLWKEEPEVVIKDSHMIMDRIVVDDESNEIYNSGRRRVVKLVGPDEPIETAQDADSPESQLVFSRGIDISEGDTPVHVKLSVALHSESKFPCFLSYGQLKYGQETVLTLSRKDASIASIGNKSIARSSLAQNCDATTLVKLASCLIASHIVSRMPSDGTTLVCGASQELARVTSSLAARSGRKVLFVKVTSKQQSERAEWISIHPHQSTRSINKLVPCDTAALFNLSQTDTNLVLPYLPTSCTIQGFDTRSLTQQSVEEAIDIYQMQQDVFRTASTPTIVNIKDVPQRRDANPGHLSVVTKWDREAQIGVIRHPLDPSTLISPNKTYFLVGMASDLGQSLTYFLVRGGARYIVLSSRNPKEQPWVKDLGRDGIDIRVVKMDVTDRSQVRETVSLLRRTMPQIGGVTNAALVLEPGVFANLSAESIGKQLQPKVSGTAHLDDEFRTDKLDFFMTFGSLLTVCGNAGQPMYHAGNTFMMSMVRNRRRRGLAASILNFGMLVDVGYVARSDRSGSSNVEEWLRSFVPTALSEADFHHVILQGIIEGNPATGSGEVIMGLETFTDRGQAARPSWVDSAFLSHMVRVSRSIGEETTDKAPASTQQWQLELENSSSVDEAIPPITELLSAKIESMIHVSLHSIHPDEPLSHLGIDSINAIAIRKWFREKMAVDISMLKIFGRDSSSSIIRTVAEQYLDKKSTQNTMPAKLKTQPAPQGEIRRESATLMPKATLTGETQPNTSAMSTSTPNSIENEASPTSYQQSTTESSIVTPEPDLEYLQSERLSYAQSGWFYLNTISEMPSSFNLTVKINIKGQLSVDRFSRAFDATMLHYDALQTCFLATAESSEPKQHVIKRKRQSRLTLLHSTAETGATDVKKAFEETAKHEYDLSIGDTLHATLISHGKQSHTLVLGFHNIAIDAFSMAHLMGDIGRAYQFAPLSPHPTSYLDFTRQQINDVRSGRFDDSLEYWKKLLSPAPEPLPLLPLAKVKTRRRQRAYGHHYIEKVLDGELVQRIDKVIRHHHVTPMQFYLSALHVLLCRLLNIDDLCIGVVFNGRDPTSKFGGTIGHLADVLPLRSKGVLGKSFLNVLKDTAQNLLDCLDNANVPFAAILEKMRPETSEGNMPMFQIAYDYRGVEESRLSPMGGCTLTLGELNYTTLYDMTVDVLHTASGDHVLNMRLSDDFYSLEATQFMTETLINVLETISQEPTASVKDYKLFSNAQIQQAATAAQGSELQYSWPNSLCERFNQVATSFPKSVAVKHGSETITYFQLRAKAGLYARILIEANITKGSRVAVHCEPSIDFYAVMLAVFHVGAVFVPLDVSLPAARRKTMLRACNPDVLVFHRATAASAIEETADHAIRSFDITKLAQDRQQDSPIPKRVPCEAESDSCILFTSGSTGAPKGIRLHQRALMTYAEFASRTHDFGQITVLQQTSFGFDLSLAQIYSAFTNGGVLVVAPVEARGDPDMLSRLMVDEKIEYTMCTPSEYTLLLTYADAALRQCRSWRFAGTAGEALPQLVVDGIRGLKLPNLTLTDCYGPTEAFIVTCRDIPVRAAASYDKSEDQNGSIGHALPNTSIYITSEHDGSLLPQGIAGEICIGGAGVANGYLSPEMSDAKFVKNPFATTEQVDARFRTMYKSGDRGILHPDGSVIFLGRTRGGNAVVKLRGLRVDLGEVAGAVLEAAPDDLINAAVTVRGDAQLLVCHVVFRHGKTLSNEQLTQLVRTMTLPLYMIPSAIVPLERLPMTPNGKLDTAALEALPLPLLSRQEQDEADMTETEAILRNLWINIIGEVAESADIGPSSSFFLTGGNSLHLVHLQYAIRARIGVKVHLRVLEQAVDLRAMATIVDREVL
ncbi:polyketide synthase 3, partial [Metarhizium majus ARSEF 297]